MFLPRESIGDGRSRTQPHHVALNSLGEISNQQMPAPCHTAAQPVEMEWRFTARRSHGRLCWLEHRSVR